MKHIKTFDQINEAQDSKSIIKSISINDKKKKLL